MNIKNPVEAAILAVSTCQGLHRITLTPLRNAVGALEVSYGHMGCGPRRVTSPKQPLVRLISAPLPGPRQRQRAVYAASVRSFRTTLVHDVGHRRCKPPKEESAILKPHFSPE